MNKTGRINSKHEKLFREIDLSWHIMMSNLVPLVLHELNNPLTAINAYSSLLIKSDDLEMIKKDIAVAIREGNVNLTAISEACQTLYRLESHIDRIRFSDVFEPLHFFLSVKFRRYGVSLSTEMNHAAEYLHCPQRYMAVATYTLMINMLATAMALADGRISVIQVSNTLEKEGDALIWGARLAGEWSKPLPAELPGSGFLLPELVGAEPEPFFGRIANCISEASAAFQVDSCWAVEDDTLLLRSRFPLF